MSRPIKDGVDYFPFDCAFFRDDKTRLLRAEFGAKGMYLLTYILCELYEKNGYFLRWDKSRCFLVSDSAGCGCSPEFVEEFIEGCLRCSFFDDGVARAFGVLTSPGIQRRYVRMFNSRDFLHMEGAWFLLDPFNKKDVPKGALLKLALFYESTENPVKITENYLKNAGKRQIKVEVTNVTQSKVKVTFVTQNEKNTTTTNVSYFDTLTDKQQDKYLKFQRDVQEYFDYHHYLSSADNFIVYNESRHWIGVGGESVREDFAKYADEWEKCERLRKGLTLEGIGGL